MSDHRRPSPWPILVPASELLISHGKKRSQSSQNLFTWLVNPNLPSRNIREPEWYVARALTPQRTCSQSHGSRQPPTRVAMHGRRIALHHYSPSGREAPGWDQAEFSQAQTPTVVVCRRRQIGLLWERASQLVDLGLLFSAVAHEWHPGACTSLSAGPSPLHHFTECILYLLHITYCCIFFCKVEWIKGPWTFLAAYPCAYLNYVCCDLGK